MDKPFHLATTWGTHYIIGEDDGQGNVPKEIKPYANHYEIIFEHGQFTVKVYGVAYVKCGDYKALKAQTEPKVKDLLKVVK